MPGKIGLLWQIADAGARLHEALAVVRLDQAGCDLQERGLARAVSPNQADALARSNGQFDAVEQGRATEAERDIAELYEWRGHSAPW